MKERLARIAIALLLTGAVAGGAGAVTGDIVFERKGKTPADSVAVAVFPHWFHRIRYKCYVCHPVPFKMKAGANKVTMDEIMAGKSCGSCHDGKTAWPVGFDTCNRCHTGK